MNINTNNNDDITQLIKNWQQRIENVLIKYLPSDDERLSVAIRYATLNGGKRMRAVLTYAIACDFNVVDKVDEAAAAIEMIHASSLVHDDLPAMDDDDLRRGKASTHKAFDEATAILAGDALLSLAFETLASSDLSAPERLIQMEYLAKATGCYGLVGGQMLDLVHTATGGSLEQLERIHLLKTAALIGAALSLGSFNRSAAQDETIKKIGIHIGMAYQITDDVLDITSDTKQLGKTAGKDNAQKKLSYPNLIGIEASKKCIKHHHQQAIELMQTLPQQGQTLQKVISYISKRYN